MTEREQLIEGARDEMLRLWYRFAEDGTKDSPEGFVACYIEALADAGYLRTPVQPDDATVREVELAKTVGRAAEQTPQERLAEEMRQAAVEGRLPSTREPLPFFSLAAWFLNYSDVIREMQDEAWDACARKWGSERAIADNPYREINHQIDEMRIYSVGPSEQPPFWGTDPSGMSYESEAPDE